MSKSIWDEYWSTRWRVGNINWLTDGRKVMSRSDPWIAMAPSGHSELEKNFTTHAGAIAYAQTEARHTCVSCGRRMPYLEACIDGRPFCHPDEGKDCYAKVSRTLALELGGFCTKVTFEAGNDKR